MARRPRIKSAAFHHISGLFSSPDPCIPVFQVGFGMILCDGFLFGKLKSVFSTPEPYLFLLHIYVFKLYFKLGGKIYCREYLNHSVGGI